MGKRWTSLDLRRDRLPSARVCLGFYISLNGPPEMFTTTLSGLQKRHNQGSSPLTTSQYNHTGSSVPASQAVLGSTKEQPRAARSRDLPQKQEAAQVLSLQPPLLLEKPGRAKGTAKPPLTSPPISSQRTSLCSPQHRSDTQRC